MFSKSFQRKYALTDQGVKNTKKGAFWTVIVNLVVMGGMGMLLLALLEGRDMYGYEMIEALRARSNEVFHLKAGTLYPLLHSLEAQGWVTSSDGVANGRTRRYYAITRDGRAALAEQQAGWYAYADAVRGVLEGGNPCGA